jgi:peptidoglycan/xylan/chitin deacetylase (PgdA/CDA1 family)
MITRLKAPLRKPFAWLLDLASRWSARRAGLVVVYHRVGDPHQDRLSRLDAAMGTKPFEAQVRHLRRRYRIVPAAELPAAVGTRRRGQRFPAAITFDDDLPSHAATAMPILRRLGAPATFFVSGTSLHAPYAFWWQRLQLAADRGAIDVGELARELPAPPPGEASTDVLGAAARIRWMAPDRRAAVEEMLLRRIGSDPPDAGMRLADLRALIEAGFEIGFHTARHHPLTVLDDDALARALEDGRAELESHVGRHLRSIAYPHGEADARVARAARAAGYQLGFTSEPEPVLPDSEPLLLGRLDPPPWAESAGKFAVRAARVIRSAPATRPGAAAAPAPGQAPAETR